MEIERKFLLKDNKHFNLSEYESKKLVQGYLSTSPVVRVRHEGDAYYLTYKGSGLMAHEEYNLPLTEESFEHLIQKADGNIISKTRYYIPLANPTFRDGFIQPEGEMLTIELDVFEAPFDGLIMAEIEFSSVEEADNYIMPDYFAEDVTSNREYHNSNMSQKKF